MEWAVERLSRARNTLRSFTGANGPECERETGRTKRVSAAVEVRL
jgi:hypothetical protein